MIGKRGMRGLISRLGFIVRTFIRLGRVRGRERRFVDVECLRKWAVDVVYGIRTLILDARLSAYWERIKKERSRPICKRMVRA